MPRRTPVQTRWRTLLSRSFIALSAAAASKASSAALIEVSSASTSHWSERLNICATPERAFFGGLRWAVARIDHRRPCCCMVPGRCPQAGPTLYLFLALGVSFFGCFGFGDAIGELAKLVGRDQVVIDHADEKVFDGAAAKLIDDAADLLIGDAVRLDA